MVFEVGWSTAYTPFIVVFFINIFISQKSSFSFLYFLPIFGHILRVSCILPYNHHHAWDSFTICLLLTIQVIDCYGIKAIHQNKCFTTPYLFTLYRHSYRLYKRCGKIRRRKKRQTILLKLSSVIPVSCLNIAYPYEFALTGSC